MDPIKEGMKQAAMFAALATVTQRLAQANAGNGDGWLDELESDLRDSLKNASGSPMPPQMAAAFEAGMEEMIPAIRSFATLANKH